MPSVPQSSTYARRVSADEVSAALGPFDELEPIGGRSGSGECWVVRSGEDRHVIKIVVHEHEPGRFEREVAALARLDSPRVMRVQDHGDVITSSGTFPYLRLRALSLRRHRSTAVPQCVGWTCSRAAETPEPASRNASRNGRPEHDQAETEPRN
jgi:hypothetical protein